ncbi:MAG: site-specific DNA-methyltransferase [Alphaproteobacteria bacterium]|nr:site-specific DNA-methyltransferase [Alphaproteobacteria bacterium]
MLKKAPRNKTLELSEAEVSTLAAEAIQLSKKTPVQDLCNQIIWQDMFEAVKYMPSGCVDLMIVDPPYNLNKNFGNSTFKMMKADDYAKWLNSWLKITARLLKDNASVYICTDWRSSISVPAVAEKYFVLQNRISWEREKGRGAQNNWKNCLEDIWFFTRSKNYKFNIDAVKVLRPVRAPYTDTSGRPKDWFDTQNQKMRLTYPSNIWTDISVPFWSMPENTPHPTQKPEKLIAKLILASSDEGDVVFDPFLGSGTTAVVAKKLGRKFIGIEKEREYIAYAIKRLAIADKNRQIQGIKDGIFTLRNM